MENNRNNENELFTPCCSYTIGITSLLVFIGGMGSLIYYLLKESDDTNEQCGSAMRNSINNNCNDSRICNPGYQDLPIMCYFGPKNSMFIKKSNVNLDTFLNIYSSLAKISVNFYNIANLSLCPGEKSCADLSFSGLYLCASSPAVNRCYLDNYAIRAVPPSSYSLIVSINKSGVDFTSDNTDTNCCYTTLCTEHPPSSCLGTLLLSSMCDIGW